MCDDIAFDIWQWAAERQIWVSAAHIPGSENVVAGTNSRIFERSSEWKLRQRVFKYIVRTFGKPDIDLFASRINHHLSNYISWRPDPGAKAVDAISINWSATYNYCFPPFSIILKVVQKIQQDKAQAIVVVPYWATQNWFLVLLGMLVDHPLIMTTSLDILYLPTHQTTPHLLHPKLKLLVAYISGVTSIHKMFLQRHNIYSCPFGENQPGGDITQCCNSGMISVGGKKPIICYQMCLSPKIFH